MLKASLAVVAAILSIWFVRPLIGGDLYTIIGIVCGLTAAVVVIDLAIMEHASHPATIGFALVIGVLVGLFWPGAAVAMIIWLSVGGDGPRPGPEVTSGSA